MLITPEPINEIGFSLATYFLLPTHPIYQRGSEIIIPIFMNCLHSIHQKIAE